MSTRSAVTTCIVSPIQPAIYLGNPISMQIVEMKEFKQSGLSPWTAFPNRNDSFSAL
jgi:hypothetical protein